MFKRMRRRFALFFSLSSFGVMLLIFGALNIGLYYASESSIRSSLEEAFSLHGSETDPKAPPEDRMRPRSFFVDVSTDPYTLEGAEAFPMRPDEIREEAKRIVSADSSYGTFSRTHFLYKADEHLICFLDTEAELSARENNLVVSGSVSLAAFLLLSLLGIFLAPAIIRPYEILHEKEQNFMTDVSHELKTPLAIIGADAEAGMVSEGEEKDRYFTNILKQNARLGSLIEELITLNRLGESASHEPLSELPLSEILLDAVESYGPLFKKRGITVKDSIDPDVSVLFEERMLVRLLGIFFDNAAKYCPDGKEFEVTLHNEKKGPKLVFENPTAETIDEEEAKRLFDRFYTRDKARSKERSGFGIGLSLAKEIATRYGAKLSVSCPEQKALRFELVFKR